MPAKRAGLSSNNPTPDGVRGTRATGLKRSRPFPLRATLELDVWGLTRMSNPTKHSLHLQPLPGSNVFDFRTDSHTWASTAELKSRGAKTSLLFLRRSSGRDDALLQHSYTGRSRRDLACWAGRCFGSGVTTSNPDARHVSTVHACQHSREPRTSSQSRQ